MKTAFVILTALFAAFLLSGCGTLSTDLDAKSVIPSRTILAEERPVGAFTGVDLRTAGRVIITQGESESLVIEGSDNLLPLIETSLQDGVLVIEMQANSGVLSADKNGLLTYKITVKDLHTLTVSGLGAVEVPALQTSSLDLRLNGAGSVRLQNLQVGDLIVTISGLGGATLSGSADRLLVSIPGAGGLVAADLQSRTAEVAISGLGSALLWVTDELVSTITGAGSVSYYGSPAVDKTSAGSAAFVNLGSR